MDAQMISLPEKRQRRARARLVAWAGILAMVLQLAAPLMGAVAAQAFADDGAGEAFTAAICSSVAGTAHRSGDGDNPDAPSKDSLPCTLCFVCQAGALGAKLAASASLPAIPERAARRVENSTGVFSGVSSGSQRPPSRAPPALV